MALRCVIVDDNAHFLETARDMLQREGIAVVGVAGDSAEAMERVAELRPDLVIIDVCLGDDECGVTLTSTVTGAGPRVGPKVILTSVYAEDDLADLIGDTAAVAFLHKSQLSGDAVRGVLRARGEPADGGPANGRPVNGGAPIGNRGT